MTPPGDVIYRQVDGSYRRGETFHSLLGDKCYPVGTIYRAGDDTWGWSGAGWVKEDKLPDGVVKFSIGVQIDENG